MFLRTRLAIASTAVAAVAAGVGLGAMPAQAQDLTSCQFTGTGQFYDFSGTLSNCQTTGSGAPAVATLETGTDIAAVVNGQTYRGPASTGSGNCVSWQAQGYALVQWADGGRTIYAFSETGANSVAAVTTTVLPSMSLTASDGSSVTIYTTRSLTAAAALQYAPAPPCQQGFPYAVSGAVQFH